MCFRSNSSSFLLLLVNLADKQPHQINPDHAHKPDLYLHQPLKLLHKYHD